MTIRASADPGAARRSIRTMVVDDSAVARQLLVSILQGAGDFEVIDAVSDGERAVALAGATRPDLITMDLHLPGINGIEAIRRIMAAAPIPIAVVSASSNLEDGAIFRALEAGALTVVKRPMPPGHLEYLRRRRGLLNELRKIARPEVEATAPAVASKSGIPVRQVAPARDRVARRPENTRVDVIAIGASTGGPAALHAILRGLPRRTLPPIVVVQHMTPGFVAGLARWLSDVAPGPVRVARDGEALAPGVVLLAPDDHHMVIEPGGTVRLRATPPVGGHRPSATTLFESILSSFGARSIGVLLSGMGQDGAEGLAQLRQQGSVTIAQDRASSVVFGMPRAAVELGAVTHVLPLSEIAPALARLTSPPERRTGGQT